VGLKEGRRQKAEGRGQRRRVLSGWQQPESVAGAEGQLKVDFDYFYN
jgi:hypothetical protein